MADKFEFKAIPTVYGGVQLKSRFEAQTARLIDCMGWKWEYEAHSFMLPSGINYMPDFWLPEYKGFFECRGYRSEKSDSQIREFQQMVRSGLRLPDGTKVIRYVVAIDETMLLVDEVSADAFQDLSQCESCGMWVPVSHRAHRRTSAHFAYPCPRCSTPLYHCHVRPIRTERGAIFIDDCGIENWSKCAWSILDLRKEDLREILTTASNVLIAAEHSNLKGILDFAQFKVSDGNSATMVLPYDQNAWDARDLEFVKMSLLLSGAEEEDFEFKEFPAGATPSPESQG